MGIQNQVTAGVIVTPETTFGVAETAGSANAKKLRRVTSSLALGKDIYQSQEARTDQQIADMRHGTKRPGGGIQGELCNVAYDTLLAAALRTAWVAGAVVLPATYTTMALANTSGTVGASGSLGTITWTAGDPVAAGLRLGDIVRLTGAAFSPYDTVNYRIVSFGGTSNRAITVTPSPGVIAAVAGTNIAVQGNKAVPGVLQPSFNIEQLFGDVGVSELYLGMRLGSAAIHIPPNGLATASFGFMGTDMLMKTGGSSPYFTSPAAIGTDGIFAGPNGSLRFGGAEQGIVTGVDINIDLGLSADPVVGSTTVPNIFYGPINITGNVSAYLQDANLINVFVNETEVELVALLEATAASGAKPFMAFNMQRVKLGGATKTVGGNGGVIVTFPFTALKPLASVNVDTGPLTIQRYN